MRTDFIKEAIIDGSIYDKLKTHRPASKIELMYYVSTYLDIKLSPSHICHSHCSPLDYLWHAFNCDFAPSRTNGDCVVWANRSGGKTFLAAAATLLDCIFKPNCQVRILAGSGSQAHRMFDYLCGFIHKNFEEFLAEPAKKNMCRFKNGSNVEVLTQSSASVRGSHVQKLRCDEAELFKPEIFQAAQFIANSSNKIIAATETLSTMHQPFGIMHDIIERSKTSNSIIFKWCLWEVIEKCTEDRSCSRCALNDYCQSKARQSEGFLLIDDVISQMKRASRANFESEMLCLRPSLQNVVFAEFNPAVHVKPVRYSPALPLYRSIDFGFVNPFVCLWLQSDSDGSIRVIDEYVMSKKTIDYHAAMLKQKTPCSEVDVAASFCDPAGAGVNDITGTSAISRLRSLGITLRYRKSTILEGIEIIRRYLQCSDGVSRIIISPRCGKLIEALSSYHYPAGGNMELPQKDGIYDHHIDALRYFFINYTRPHRARIFSY